MIPRERAISRSAEVPGASLKRGPRTGPPVLLLHGWPQSAAAWAPMMAIGSPGTRLIAVDLPGIRLFLRSAGHPAHGDHRGGAPRVRRRVPGTGSAVGRFRLVPGLPARCGREPPPARPDRRPGALRARGRRAGRRRSLRQRATRVGPGERVHRGHRRGRSLHAGRAAGTDLGRDRRLRARRLGDVT